uniref:Uncharacterized protein n=1 Tax=Oryza nivara TaxID=4536 RepID=A0A0E0FUR1_ORYNI
MPVRRMRYSWRRQG